jgi:hypothetical protein
MKIAELTRLCTGEIEREVGMIVHDGESCPIHESLEGYRTELQDPSGIPVRYVTIEQLYEEKGS